VLAQGFPVFMLGGSAGLDPGPAGRWRPGIRRPPTDPPGFGAGSGPGPGSGGAPARPAVHAAGLHRNSHPEPGGAGSRSLSGPAALPGHPVPSGAQPTHRPPI